ncbi:hypothetical protein [Helicobacter canis]|uniref:hypothetical protein n=1 Tax=Helicobacter canis TaxID=29419 RepID=UPI002943B43A|nr:hypothetical protein [Helicobacter canis]
MGEQCGSVAIFVKGTNAKFANLPQKSQSSHSPTAILRIVLKFSPSLRAALAAWQSIKQGTAVAPFSNPLL